MRGSSTACDECEGLGEIWRVDGRKFCKCELGRKAFEEMAAQTRRGLWDAAEVPARFKDWRLDGCPDRELAARLKFPDHEEHDTAEEMDAIGEWLKSWFFWGKYGTGKTGLAVGYLWERVKLEYSCRFLSVPTLLSELRDTYRSDGGSEMEVLRRYQKPDILLMDDLGAEHVKDTGWLEDRLYQIVGDRHAEMRMTVFTSNLSPDELGARIGPRIMWRIVEMCGKANCVEVKGKNLRAEG